MTKYNLEPGSHDRVKSFYGKAAVIETDDNEIILQSYETYVCKIDAAGNFIKMWNGYSATTMRHINAFIDRFNISGGGKKWWDTLQTEVQ